jgi:hypothetical protein
MDIMSTFIHTQSIFQSIQNVVVLMDPYSLVYIAIGILLIYIYWKLFHQPFNLFRVKSLNLNCVIDLFLMKCWNV